MNVEEIFSVLKQRINVEDCCQTDKSLPNYSFNLDGVSATGKTSIIESCGLPHSKVQRRINVINSDTYFPSMLGYVSEGMQAQLYPPWRINDRSPLNCIEWRLLWSLASHLVDKHGPGGGFCAESGKIIEEEDAKYIDEAFDSLMNSYFYRDLRARLHGLAIIDSNVTRCNQRRSMRNESLNDVLRSKWPWYTPLQNIMYKKLYPNAYIDLMWFDHADDGNVFKAISKFIVYIVDNLKQQHEKIESLPLPLPIVLPSNYNDYFLKNMSVHVDRNYARIKCKRILADECSEESMETMMPRCVEVYNVDEKKCITKALYRKLN